MSVNEKIKYIEELILNHNISIKNNSDDIKNINKREVDIYDKLKLLLENDKKNRRHIIKMWVVKICAMIILVLSALDYFDEGSLFGKIIEFILLIFN